MQKLIFFTVNINKILVIIKKNNNNKLQELIRSTFNNLNISVCIYIYSSVYNSCFKSYC